MLRILKQRLFGLKGCIMLGSCFSRCNIAAKSVVFPSLSHQSRLQKVSKNLSLPICSQHHKLIAPSKTLSRIITKVPALPALLWVPVRGNACCAGTLDLCACSRLHDKQGAANTHPSGSTCTVPADGVTLPTSPGWSH